MADLREGVSDERFCRLMQFEIERAEQYFGLGSGLTEYLASDGRRIFGAMSDTYHGLLDHIRRAAGDVLHRRVRVSRFRKMWIAAHWLVFHGSIFDRSMATARTTT
jgi:phytoene synthase